MVCFAIGLGRFLRIVVRAVLGMERHSRPCFAELRKLHQLHLFLFSLFSSVIRGNAFVAPHTPSPSLLATLIILFLKY